MTLQQAKEFAEYHKDYIGTDAPQGNAVIKDVIVVPTNPEAYTRFLETYIGSGKEAAYELLKDGSFDVAVVYNTEAPIKERCVLWRHLGFAP